MTSLDCAGSLCQAGSPGRQGLTSSRSSALFLTLAPPSPSAPGGFGNFYTSDGYGGNYSHSQVDWWGNWGPSALPSSTPAPPPVTHPPLFLSRSNFILPLLLSVSTSLLQTPSPSRIHMHVIELFILIYIGLPSTSTSTSPPPSWIHILSENAPSPPHLRIHLCLSNPCTTFFYFFSLFFPSSSKSWLISLVHIGLITKVVLSNFFLFFLIIITSCRCVGFSEDVFFSSWSCGERKKINRFNKELF